MARSKYHKLSNAEVTIIKAAFARRHCFYLGSDGTGWKRFKDLPERIQKLVQKGGGAYDYHIYYLDWTKPETFSVIANFGDRTWWALTPDLKRGLSRKMLRYAMVRFQKWDTNNDVMTAIGRSFLVGIVAAMLAAASVNSTFLRVDWTSYNLTSVALLIAFVASWVYGALRFFLNNPWAHYRKQAELGKALFELKSAKTPKEIEEDNGKFFRTFPSREAVLKTVFNQKPEPHGKPKPT